MVDHLHHAPFAAAQRLGDDADKGVRAIDDRQLDGFQALAVFAAGDDFGLRHLKLVTFAAHHLDDDGKLQFAAPRDLEGVHRVAVFDADGDIGEGFFVEPLADFS